MALIFTENFAVKSSTGSKYFTKTTQTNGKYKFVVSSPNGFNGILQFSLNAKNIIWIGNGNPQKTKFLTIGIL